MLFKLYLAFLSIGAVAFGGGYAMLPLFERIVVIERAWLDMELFIDMIAISQMTPGPIAINSATFIGYRVAGVIGSMVATLGVISVPIFLVALVSKFYEQFKNSKVIQGIFMGLRPALVGLILASVYSVGKNAIVDWMGFIIIAVLMLLLVKTKIHPILLIILSGIIGVFVYYIF